MDDGELIQHVASFSFLYDKKQPNFKNKTIKENAWTTIGEVLEQSDEICEQRWTVLHAKYTGLRRQLKTIPSGSKAIRQSCSHFDAMGFLEPFLVTRNCSYGPGNPQKYVHISNFKHLRRLTMEFFPELDAEFLSKVLQTCQRLEGLNVVSASYNKSLNLNLYASLKYATNLLDFRLENQHVDFGGIFSSLKDIPSRKLQRVFIKCIPTDINDVEPVKNFLRTNDQLIFVCVEIPKLSTANGKKLFEVMKTDHPAKVYCVKRENDFLSTVLPIPLAHDDILYRGTRVAVTDFTTF